MFYQFWSIRFSCDVRTVLKKKKKEELYSVVFQYCSCHKFDVKRIGKIHIWIDLH